MITIHVVSQIEQKKLLGWVAKKNGGGMGEEFKAVFYILGSTVIGWLGFFMFY